jgi:hypothetical protein
MIPEELLRVLERDMYYLTSTFNGAPNLVEAMKATGLSDTQIVRRIYAVLSHPHDVKVVSPWDKTFPLFDEVGEELYGESTIVPSSPYSIHTLDGELIYRVYPHGGWFGTSTLDRVLLMQSYTGDMYYLQYRTFTRPYTYLLVINNQSMGQLSINPPGLVEPEGSPHTVPADNYITFSTSRKGRLELRYLESTPITVPSTTAIKERGSVEYYTLENWDDKFIWFPQGAGWVSIYIDGAPLPLMDIEGVGIDRVVLANDYTLYVAHGDIDMTSVRQALGETVRRPPDLSRDRTIKVRVTLK